MLYFTHSFALSRALARSSVTPLARAALVDAAATMSDAFASFNEACDDFTARVAAGWDGFFSSTNRRRDESGRIARARATGIVSERYAGHVALPSYACELGEKVRVLDIGQNAIASLEETALGRLTGTTQARLDGNALRALPRALFDMTRLRTLDVRGNRLRAIPDAIDRLRALEQLNMDDNELETLPASLGRLTRLRRVTASGNKLRDFACAAALGSCDALEVVSFAKNVRMRGAIPSSWSRLERLKEIDVDETAVESVPAEIFSGCVALHTLSARACSNLDIGALKSTPGYDEYERRRVDKHTKQIESRVLLDSARLDERLW